MAQVLSDQHHLHYNFVVGKRMQGPGNRLPEAILLAIRSQLGAPYEVPDRRHPGMAVRARLILTERFLSGANR